MKRKLNPVDTVDWNTIGKCNLRCLHCYGPDKKLGALPIESLHQIVDRMHLMQVKRVVLTGGEPLITPGIDEVLAHLHACGIEIALSTNGTFVEGSWDTISCYVTSLNIPLDGHTPLLHARSRADTSTFYTNLAVLDRYRNTPLNRPPKLRVGTVYSEATKGHMQSIAAMLLPYADVITTWKVYELINHEMQQELRASILHNPADFVTELEKLKKVKIFQPLVKKMMIASAHSRNRAYFMLNPKGLVVVPTKIAGITVEKVVGHFLKDSIEDIVAQWNKCVNHEKYADNHKKHYER